MPNRVPSQRTPAKVPTAPVPEKKPSSVMSGILGALAQPPDGFDKAMVAGILLPPSKPLPEAKYMKTSGGIEVVSQREATDFYCEHALFVLNEEGNKAGTSIFKDSTGKPLVGFIHLAGALDRPGSPTRQAQTAEVVGAGLRGDVDSIRATDPKTSPVKVLLTGYGPWGSVKDNCSGNFVSDPKNLDAAMKSGFGDALVGEGKTVQTPAGAAREYTLKDEKTGEPYTVQVLGKQLDVNDSAIDGGPSSLQTLLEQFKPQAAISMGTDPSSFSYDVVSRSDFGGLTREDGKLKHDATKMLGGAESREQETSNDSLGRAIAAGDAARRTRPKPVS